MTDGSIDAMPSFSVVIPAYNRAHFLPACLESVFAQSVAPLEVIVVDDGSSDDTPAVLDRYRDRIIMARQANAGPGAARNHGARLAAGDYLAFLDSDDLWPSWALETYRDVIIQADHPALVFGAFVDMPSDQAAAPSTRAALDFTAYRDFLSTHGEPIFAGAGMMAIEAKAFAASGGFLEDRLNAEDHDLALRLGVANGFARITTPMTVAHRLHASNEMGDVAKTLAGLSRLVEQERRGAYPGGAGRGDARREIIARHVRASVIAGAAAPATFSAAARLFMRTAAWQFRLGRWRFLAAASGLIASSAIRRAFGPKRVAGS